MEQRITFGVQQTQALAPRHPLHHRAQEKSSGARERDGRMLPGRRQLLDGR
jgi:hypothetical protein